MKNLLEFVYETVQDICLSEIHQPETFKTKFIFLLDIEENKFTLDDWKYTYAYITQSTQNIGNSVSEIKEALRRWASL